MEFQFTLQGAAKLSAELQALPVRIEKNILRGMIRAASKPVRDEARSLAPRLQDDDPRREVGALAASVRVMSTLLKGGMVKGGVVAGSMKRTLKSPADAFYAKWVEYGRNGQSPQPFLRPAGGGKANQAIALAAEYVRARIDAGDLKA